MAALPNADALSMARSCGLNISTWFKQSLTARKPNGDSLEVFCG